MAFNNFDVATPLINAQDYNRNALVLQDAEERKIDNLKIRELRGQAYDGNQDAIRQIGVISPSEATAVANALEGIKRSPNPKVFQDNAKQIKGFVSWVDAKPEEERAKAWSEGLGYLKNMGIDVSQIGEYDEGKKAFLSAFADKVINETGQETFGEMEQVPGAPQGVLGQKSSKTGKYVNIQKPSQGIRFKSGDTSLAIGGQPDQFIEANKDVAKEAQKRMTAADEHAARMQRLDNLYNPEFMTFLGRMGVKLSNFRDKAQGIPLIGQAASEEDRRKIKQFRRFTQLVNYEFNQYRKEITGAAAALQEIEDLKKAMFSDDLSAPEFEAAFDEFKLEVERGRRINEQLLTQGVSTKSPNYESMFNDLYFSSDFEDYTGKEPGKDAETRMQELLNSGVNYNQALDQLIKEGF